jgi:transcription initiation factor IIF auxiliary subunit
MLINLTKIDMDKLADGLQKLQEDDLLQVVQMVHDNKAPDTYIKNDVERKPTVCQRDLLLTTSLHDRLQRVNSMWIYIPFQMFLSRCFGNT